jgi:regulator of sirC expression with transglutaminase-like and TPR domain
MIWDSHVRIDAALAEFAVAVRRPENEIDLGRAMLVLGKFVYPKLDVASYEQRLDDLAVRARAAIGAAGQTQVSASALGRYLFRADGADFRGNAQDYADPRNSYLNELLDRRLGLPITLAVLYMEVARRLGVRAAGVGLPGHFVVQAWEADGAIVRLDPFHGGNVLTVADCYELAAATAQASSFEPQWLQPVGARHILTRVLNNLRNRGPAVLGVHGMIGVFERQLVLDAQQHSIAAMLGLLCATAGQRQRAAELLTQALQGELDSEVRARAEAVLQAKLAEIAARN